MVFATNNSGPKKTQPQAATITARRRSSRRALAHNQALQQRGVSAPTAGTTAGRSSAPPAAKTHNGYGAARLFGATAVGRHPEDDPQTPWTSKDALTRTGDDVSCLRRGYGGGTQHTRKPTTTQRTVLRQTQFPASFCVPVPSVSSCCPPAVAWLRPNVVLTNQRYGQGHRGWGGRRWPRQPAYTGGPPQAVAIAGLTWPLA